jgi:putative oxidoreductase
MNQLSQVTRARVWMDANRDVGWDVLRVYLGVALFIKGLVFLKNVAVLREIMASAGFLHPWLAEPIAVTHLAGGMLLTFGLWTRFAAAVQAPVLLGAILFIHLKDGLFRPAQTLEFTLLVLVLLCLFALGGAGRLSVDFYFKETLPSPMPRSLESVDPLEGTPLRSHV